jgi:hypothetical protein
MKPPPDTPEFARFTEALGCMMKVSKVEMNRREHYWCVKYIYAA